MIDDYAWRGGREAMLRLGDGAPTVILVAPLFEEANRLRATLVAVMRGLAARGIASVLPDLPGTNDSLVATVDARIENWRAALGAVAASLGGPLVTLAVRGGALIDDIPAAAHWRLAPETGERLLRDMVRATAMSAGMKPMVLAAEARERPALLGGNLVHPTLFTALEAATPHAAGSVRTARLSADTAAADVVIAGSPVWRRAEPGVDRELTAAIVTDVAALVQTCAAR